VRLSSSKGTCWHQNQLFSLIKLKSTMIFSLYNWNSITFSLLSQIWIEKKKKNLYHDWIIKGPKCYNLKSKWTNSPSYLKYKLKNKKNKVLYQDWIIKGSKCYNLKSKWTKMNFPPIFKSATLFLHVLHFGPFFCNFIPPWQFSRNW
jgi:hypothetical protein